MKIALVVLLSTLNAASYPADSITMISEPMESMKVCRDARTNLMGSDWFHKTNKLVAADKQKVEILCEVSGIEKEIVAGTFDWSSIK